MAKSKEAASAEAAPEAKKVSKMEAVRQTLAGGIVKPLEGIASIKEKFGIDIPAQIFSSYKSQIAKSAGKKPGKRGRKPGSKVSPRADEGPLGVSRRKPTGSPTGIELVREVKKLVEQYGADAVKEMADVFAS